ncbi:hypothetical protein G7046_g3997 [Stylonectria norvegica]|nr:hypothetical protein G7046_g3997 [Stylonectria norvegica]
MSRGCGRLPKLALVVKTTTGFDDNFLFARNLPFAIVFAIGKAVMFWTKKPPGSTPATTETVVDPAPADLKQGAPSASAAKDKEAKHDRLQPSTCLTGHQKFYVFGLDGVGGMAISGGVNFAIAYVMYTTQDTDKNPIRLFQLPNTLAGDAAVTTIIQCILTWFVEMALVRHDLRHRSVQPMGFIAKPSNRWLRWFCFLPLDEAETRTELPRVSVMMLLQQALRGFILAVVGFVLLWPLGVGILTVFGDHVDGDYVYSDRWTPQVFKLVFGGLLGLITTPVMATFWLVRAGWEVKPRVGD